MAKDGDEWKDDSYKKMATWMNNDMLRMRVRIIEQWKALLVARTEHTRMPYRTYDIL